MIYISKILLKEAMMDKETAKAINNVSKRLNEVEHKLDTVMRMLDKENKDNIISAEQALTDMDIQSIETQQELTDMDLRLLEVEGKLNEQ